MPHYWPGRPEQDYRSFLLRAQLTDRGITPAVVSVSNELAQIAPTVILADSDLLNTYTDRSTALSASAATSTAPCLLAHRARLIAEIVDVHGHPLQEFELEA